MTRTLGRLVRVAAFTSVSVLFAIVPEANAAVEIARVDVGFNGVYQVGVWVPVKVVLKSDQPVEGEVRLIVPDGDGVPSTIPTPNAEAVSLHPGKPTEISLFARFGRVRGWLEVHFIPKEGAPTVARFDTAADPSDQGAFRDALPTNRRLILQIGEEPIGLDRALKSSLYEEEEGAVLVRLDSIDALPRVWFGYEGVDTLVIVGENSPITAALTKDVERVKAIKQWIAMGGKAVVFVGAEGETLLGEQSELKTLIPGRFDSTTSLRRTGAYEAYCGSEKPIPLSRRRTVTIDVPKLVDVQGKVEAREGDVPLVIRAAVGFGTITFAACDPGVSPWSEWVDRSRFLRTLLGLATRDTSESGELRAVMHYGYDDMAGQLRAALDQFEGVHFVPFSLIIFLLVVYILLIGPIDYFFVGKIAGRVRMTWLTFPAIVLLFCLVGYWLSYRFKGNDVRVNQASVVDIDVESGMVRGTAWGNVFSPAMESYDLQVLPKGTAQDDSGFGARYTAWLGLPGSGIGGMDPRTNPVFWKKGYCFSPALTEMTHVPIAVWSSKSVTARWHRSTTEIPKGTFVRDAQTLSGSFTNTSSFPLKNCILAFERWVYRLGEIAPGQTVTVGTMTERSELKALLNERKLVKDKEKDRFLHEATPYDRGNLDPFYVLRMMLFFQAGGGEYYTGLENNYQRFLDMSTLIELDRAVLFAEVPADEVGAALHWGDQTATGEQAGRLSLLRFVFPVKPQ